MRYLTRTAGIGLAAALAACGGNYEGGKRGNTPEPVGQPAPANPSTPSFYGGTWYGELSNDADGSSDEVTAWFSEDLRFRFIWFDFEDWEHGAALMAGTVVLENDQFSGSGLAFAGDGAAWSDGNSVSGLSMMGVVSHSDDEGRILSGTWATESGDSGNFEFFTTWDYWASDSGVRHLVGTWGAYDTTNSVGLTISIGTDGSFIGEDSIGCSLSGQFSPIEPRVNMYDVRTTINGCDLAGEYSGLASRDGWYDAFHFSVDDGVRAIQLTFYAQR